MSIFWETPSGCVVFNAFWFDSGYMFFPVYGGFVRISYFYAVYSDPAFDSRPALRLFSVCREEHRKIGFLGAALVSTTALV